MGHNRTMQIRIVTPSVSGVRTGNRVTAQRWSRHLSALGHEVHIRAGYQRGTCDLLVALHARKSAASIERFAALHPGRPVVVALTGTDVYGDLHEGAAVLRSLQAAWRIVALQPLAAKELPQDLRSRVRVIHQSVVRPARLPRPKSDVFEVCVIGHLREVKDPFRAAEAAALLPADSRIRIVHIGAPLNSEMEARAMREVATNDRYTWLDALPPAKTLRTLARCRLMVLSSKMEGGANVISEASVCGVPVVSSRMPGSIGLLGEDYPGLFPVGDTAALAMLLQRAERDASFLELLGTRCAAIAPLFDPQRERDTWAKLLAER